MRLLRGELEVAQRRLGIAGSEGAFAGGQQRLALGVVRGRCGRGVRRRSGERTPALHHLSGAVARRAGARRAAARQGRGDQQPAAARAAALRRGPRIQGLVAAPPGQLLPPTRWMRALPASSASVPGAYAGAGAL